MEDMILSIVKEEIIPFAAEGIGAGFVLGTLFSLAAYGIFKAISLLNIKN